LGGGGPDLARSPTPELRELGNGGQKVLAVFNNSPDPVGGFDAPLPAGVTGGHPYNYIRKNADGSYGSDDPTVSWPSASTLRISAMGPWEAKIIRIAG
jgi:hypothetical protein